MSEEPILIEEREAGWLTIRFNRPDARNALTGETISRLTGILTGIRDDRSVRGVTFRGNGPVFCAGGDIKGFQRLYQGGEFSAEDVAETSMQGGRLFALINELPQVTVMLVHGAAIAGGLGLMCTGDIVVVHADTKFALTETQIGIPPAQIAPFVVGRVGLPVARRLMLAAARFDGREARSVGLADAVVESMDGLDAEEAAIRENVSRCAPGANAATKELAFAATRLSPEEMIRFAGERFAECMLSDEGREGVASFIEKRKPRWAD